MNSHWQLYYNLRQTIRSEIATHLIFQTLKLNHLHVYEDMIKTINGQCDVADMPDENAMNEFYTDKSDLLEEQLIYLDEVNRTHLVMDVLEQTDDPSLVPQKELDPRWEEWHNFIRSMK